VVSAVEQHLLPRARHGYFVRIVVVFAAQFAGGKVGDILQSTNNGGIGPVWPAAGIAIAALLLWGFSVWPGIWAGAFLLAVLGRLPLWAAIVYATGTTLAAWVGVFLLRLRKFDNSLSRLSDVLKLVILGAFGSSIASASVGACTLYAAHVRGWPSLGSAWVIYFLGDAAGVLLITPLVLTFPDLIQTPARGRLIELGSVILLTTTPYLIVYGIPQVRPEVMDVSVFAVLPFVMWVAIRLGTSGTALTTFWIATTASFLTKVGAGPFATKTPMISAVLLDVFFGVVSVTGLTLAALCAEKEHAVAERERAAREHAAVEMRLRLASIVESSDDAIISKSLDGVIESWNKAAERIFGFSFQEAIGQPITMIIPPDLRDEEQTILQGLRKGERIEHIETRRTTKAGEKVHVSLTISPILDAGGRVVGASTIARDISERKRADEALKKSEEKFAKAFRESHVAMTLTRARDNRYLDVNDTFVKLTGWQRKEVIGRTPMDIQIWVDPAQRLNVVNRLLAEGTVRDVEVLYRCKNGTQRVGLGTADVIQIENEPCVLSVIADITDRKRAEEALSSIGRKLMEAQEQERTRIARELHDDISQRLALLAVELDRSIQADLVNNTELGNRFRQVQRRLTEVASDVQGLSHRLHSSKLEILGLVSAARSFCKEVSEKNGVTVAFRHSGVPRTMSKEISLSLFRVLQEALQNAIKYGQVRNFSVDLCGTGESLELTVSDAGVGFDEQEAFTREGLGLISMRERVQMVNGEFTVTSRPGVPLITKHLPWLDEVVSVAYLPW
jgi:PAS domain S-box-containing protein